MNADTLEHTTSRTPPRGGHETRRGLPAWALVTRREVMVKLTDKAFLIGTAVTVLVIAGYLAFLVWQSERTSDYRLAATPEAVAMAEAVSDGAAGVDEKVSVSVVPVADADAARDLLVAEDATAWLHGDAESGWTFTTESSDESNLADVVREVVGQQAMAENAAAAGTTVEALVAGGQVSSDFLRGDADQAAVADAVGFVFVFLFYLASLMFGMQLAGSVIEEKQSRIVEIIAAAIPVRQLLAGKVAGNTVLAMLQVVLYVAIGMVGMSFTPYAEYVPGISGPVVWFIGFFFAGFVALACLWAVAGSLASRTEDLQSTATPLTMLMMVMFFGGIFLDGKPAVVASYIPPVSAVVMPKRILAGGVEWWEPVVALGLLAVFAAIAIAAGERLYRRALLRTGGKVSLRQAWTAAE